MCYEALNGQWWSSGGEGSSAVPLVFFVAFSKRAQFRGFEFEKLKFKDEYGQWLGGVRLGSV